MVWELAQSFPPQSDAPSSARRFVAGALGKQFASTNADQQSLIADAQLLITELITNAINAQTSRVDVSVCIDGPTLRLSVHDDALGVPEPRTAGVTDEHGRGLAIVAALGQAWGVEYGDRSKNVWVDVPLA